MNNDTIIEDMLKRVDNYKQEDLRCKNVKEWYFLSGVWIAYVVKHIKGNIAQGKRHEAVRISSQKDYEHLKRFMNNLFVKYYTCNPSDKTDKIYYVILSSVFDEEDKKYDGSEDFILGLHSECYFKF